MTRPAPFLSRYFILLLAVLAWLPGINWAATGQALQDLQRLQLVTYRTGVAYYRYALQDRNPMHHKTMETLLNEGDQIVTRAGLVNLQAKWNSYKTVALRPPYTSGMADPILMREQDSAQDEMLKVIKSAISGARGVARSAAARGADLLFDQAMLMELINNVYLRRSADVYGGAVVATSSSDIDPAKLADEFEHNMATLQKQYAANTDTSNALRSALVKWKFIRNSIRNPNEKQVPFVVATYSGQITDRLLEAHGKQPQS